MPRLYLHIGLDKTGTSAIQRFLHVRRRALRKNGVLYPQTGLRAAAHHEFPRLLATVSTPDDPYLLQREELRVRLREEWRASRCETLIISSEDFSLLGDGAYVRDMFRDFDTTVVVYLRRHDHWWCSVYNQAVRMVADPPWSRGIDAFVDYNLKHDPARGNFRALVDRWATVFGVGNLRVRPYERVQNPDGIVADFVRTVGLSSLEHEAAGEKLRVNSSLSGENLLLMDVLQRAGIDPALRAKLHRKVLALPRAETAPMPMSAASRRVIIERYRDDYAYIAKTFLGRADGRLFLEPGPDVSDNRSESPGVTEVDIATALLNLIYG